MAIAHASRKLPDGSAYHEFRGQNPLAEGHLRMMQALEKHLHAGFAYLLLMNANGGKRRIHQDGFFTVVETDQTDLVRHLHSASAQRSPESKGNLVVAGHDSSGSRPPRQDSPYAPLTEIAKTQRISCRDQDRFQFVLAHSLPVAFESAMKPRVRDISGENNLVVTLDDEVTGGVECPIEVIEAYLIESLLVVHTYHIVTEGNEGHMDGFDSVEQIPINRASQNDSVN